MTGTTVADTQRSGVIDALAAVQPENSRFLPAKFHDKHRDNYTLEHVSLPMKKKRLEVTKSRETKERAPLVVAFLEDAPISMFAPLS